MKHIFLSYSHTDGAYVRHLASELEDRGFSVWLDERIDAGAKWPHVIAQQLDACAAFIVVMTPRAYESDWVQNELARAKRKDKPVFPLLLEGDEPWLSVEVTQYVDVRGGTLPAVTFYEQLAQVAPPVRQKSPAPMPPVSIREKELEIIAALKQLQEAAHTTTDAYAIVGRTTIRYAETPGALVEANLSESERSALLRLGWQDLTVAKKKRPHTLARHWSPAASQSMVAADLIQANETLGLSYADIHIVLSEPSR